MRCPACNNDRGDEPCSFCSGQPFVRYADIRKYHSPQPGQIIDVTEEELRLIMKYGFTIEEILTLRENDEK